MANTLYDKARQRFLEAQINWLSDTLKVILVDTGSYTPQTAIHEYLADIPISARITGEGARLEIAPVSCGLLEQFGNANIRIKPPTQYIGNPHSVPHSIFGDHVVNSHNLVKPLSCGLTVISKPRVTATNTVKPASVNDSVVTKPTLNTTNVIAVEGFNASVVNTPLLIAQNVIYPHSFATSLISAPVVDFEDCKTIYAPGFNALSFGTHKAHSLNTIKTYGLYPPPFGHIKIDKVNYLAPYSFKSSTIGKHYANFRQPPRFINVKSIKRDIAFGQAQLHNQHRVIDFNGLGISFTAFAPPVVRNTSATLVYVPGFNASTINAPIINVVQNIFFKGDNHTLISNCIVSYGNTSVTIPYPIISKLKFGVTKLHHRNTVKVKATLGTQFGYANICNYHSFITPSSIESSEFGTPSIKNMKADSIAPLSFNAELLGHPLIYNKDLTQFAHQLPPVTNSNIGLHTIYNYKQYVTQVGAIGSKFAISNFADIENRNKYIKPPGMRLRFEMGRAFVSKWEREIIVQNGMRPLTIPQPFIDYKIRTIELEGFDGAQVGQIKANLQFTQTIDFTDYGFIATSFGTKLTPDTEVIYAQGFDSLNDDIAPPEPPHTIYNRIHFIKDFALVGQTEEFKYGKATIYNNQRYIYAPFHDNQHNDLAGAVVSNFAKIYHRNRTIVPDGIGLSSQLVARPYIFNNAVIIKPHSILSPDQIIVKETPWYKGTTITHGIRTINIPSIKAPLFNKWHVIGFGGNRVIQPYGFVNDNKYGTAEIANTRRYYRWVGVGQTDIFGTAFIADRIRTVAIEDVRYSIHPPVISELHNIYNARQDISLANEGIAPPEVGAQIIYTQFNRLIPRWYGNNPTGGSHVFGTAHIKNFNPEIYPYGLLQEQLGVPKIELLRQYIEPRSWQLSHVSRKFLIRDSTSYIYVRGVNYLKLGQFKAFRLGGEYIPKNHNVAVSGLTLSAFGNIKLTYPRTITPMSILPSPPSKGEVIYQGANVPSIVKNKTFGWHAVFDPRVRPQFVFAEGIDNKIKTAEDARNTRVTPHHIYAPTGDNAPGNYASNNPPWFPVLKKKIGPAEFGMPFVQQLKVTQPYIYPKGFHATGIYERDLDNQFGTAFVENSRRYITFNRGLHTLKVGYHECFGGDQVIEVFNSSDTMRFGRHRIGHYVPPLPSNYTQVIKPASFTTIFGNTNVENQHRTIYAQGNDMQLFGGQSKFNDTYYMPHNFTVHFRRNPPMQGFDASIVSDGLTIDNKKKEIYIEGLDHLKIDGFDWRNFSKRMTVTKK